MPYDPIVDSSSASSWWYDPIGAKAATTGSLFFVCRHITTSSKAWDAALSVHLLTV
jgi:hypothetical protein